MKTDEVRFVADGMLQSLGAWLRLMGYDCVTRTDAPSRSLLEQAVAEDRVFLTRNAHLNDNLPSRLLASAIVLYVLGEHLPEQIREVVAKFELDPETAAFSRCVGCNLPLERTSDPHNVPSAVAARETMYWRCNGCGKTFWRGSHVTDSLTRLRKWVNPR